MKQLKTIVILVIILAVIVVVVQNTQTVETDLLVATVTTPKSVLLLVTFLAGAVFGLLATFRVSKKSGKK